MLEGVRAGGLLESGTPLVVMLSGGRDSVCLLDIAVRLLGPGAISALHVNYGLRAEADADQRHCEELCAQLGVGVQSERAARPAGPGNLQAWAREVRYSAATRAAAEGDAAIATGDTADDQVETILYRLASSPSRRALPACALATGACCARCLPLPAHRRPPTARSAGLSGARTQATMN